MYAYIYIRLGQPARCEPAAAFQCDKRRRTHIYIYIYIHMFMYV